MQQMRSLSMRQALFLAALVPGILSGAAASALTYTSTNTPTDARQQFAVVKTSSTQTQARPAKNYSLTVSTTGVGAALSVDTDTDLGKYTGLTLEGPSTPAKTTTTSYDVNFNLVVRPPNFPDPGEIKHVQGTYTEKVTITGITASGPPTFVSGASGQIIPFGNHFGISSQVTLTVPHIFVEGTYEVNGPTSSASTPFSVEFAANSTTATVGTWLGGGLNFDNGFLFDANSLTTAYTPINPTIYNATIDDVPFKAEMSAFNVSYFTTTLFVPEPGTLGLFVVGAVALGIARGWGGGRAKPQAADPRPLRGTPC